MAGNIFLSVILPLRLNWNPCYKIAGEALEGLHPGMRVKVEFAGKIYTGIIERIGITPQTDISKIRDILSVESNLPPVSQEEIRLWRFVSEYYMCSIGEVFKAAYPAQRIAEEQQASRAEERRKALAERKSSLLGNRIARAQERLAKKTGLLSRAKKDSVKARLTEEMDAIRLEISQLEARRKELSAYQEPGNTPQGENGTYLTQTQTDAPVAVTATLTAGKTVLTKEQAEAAKKLRKITDSKGIALLKGITGSGKTEIYISLAQETLRKGKNVLYTVPEIALSRQLEDRLRTAFGAILHVFHSGETATKRRETATSVRKGPYIILGTRSSVFLPHRNLGLIIVDEEHDASYKQDSPAPRYNGRDTAIMLGSIHGCGVLLGSATPSLESLYNCATGLFSEVILNERYYEGECADIEIIDTAAERKKRGMRGSFSIKLIARIEQTLSSGGQVMILRSRRAYSPAVQCESCGHIPKCPHCNVPMSYHKNENRLVCHYCGHYETFTGICPKCGGAQTPIGAGTQKIEEEAAALFPKASIARLDSDVARSRDLEKQLIKDFSDGKTDILIGTQIVSKGFDFEGVTLVAVLQADSLMGQQDFRADERAVQVLEQFRGRCGRRGKKGLFVIQTAQPDHPVYARLSNPGAGDSDYFTNLLMAERKLFGYPPFRRIVNISLRDRSLARLELLASGLASRLAEILKTATSSVPSAPAITGPFSPAIDRVDDQYVKLIRIMLNRDKSLAGIKQKISAEIAAFEKENNCHGRIIADVDPV